MASTPSGSRIESDVCVVGAGPAGLTIASELARAGKRVTVLESGPVRSSWRAQRLNDGDVIGAPYHGLTRTRHRQVGGTANIWNTTVRGRRGAKYVPLDPLDLSQWPIGWEDLEPFYRRAQVVCGLGPFDYAADPTVEREKRRFSLEGTGLAGAVYQLGTADRFVEHLPVHLAAAEGCTLLPATTAIGVRLGPRGATVRAVQRRGRPIEVWSSQVVLACGAVENARLLLLSELPDKASLTWLGRGFMEHPRDYSLELVPDDPLLFEGASFHGPQPPRGGAPVHGRIALTAGARRAFGLPNASLSLFPRPRLATRRGLAFRAVERVHRLLGVPWAGGQSGSSTPGSAGRFDVFNVVIHLEQRPSPRNGIALGKRTDRFGNALPALELHWTAQEQAELERLHQLVGEWLREAGLGSLRVAGNRLPDLNAHHHAGTTRMGDGPTNGVVDPDARVFGTDGLYVAGGSLFPTAGFANPALTVVALALRLSDHLASL